MNVCISKKVLGTSLHLLSSDDGTITWTSKIPGDCFPVGFSDNDTFATVSKLLGKELDLTPGKQYVDMMSSLQIEDNIPWHHVVPAKAFKEFIQRIVDSSRTISTSDQYVYYQNHLAKAQRSSQRLAPVKIDENEYKRLMMDPKTMNKNVIQSFTPEAGYAGSTTYGFTTTNTGRLTVRKGPQILTLKKEHRAILKSRFPKGRIIQLDYTSLEPRVALSMIGHNPPKDIYNHVAENILDNQASRESAKLLTIALLYGMGQKRVKDILSGTYLDSRETMTKLDEFFGAQIIREELAKQATSGFIQNYYGRNIKVRNDSEHVLYNNLIQSTAVDVALQGFTKMIDKIYEEEKQMRPIFILHDALLIDCPPEEVGFLDDLCTLGSKAENLEAHFYIKKELVN